MLHVENLISQVIFESMGEAFHCETCKNKKTAGTFYHYTVLYYIIYVIT